MEGNKVVLKLTKKKPNKIMVLDDDKNTQITEKLKVGLALRILIPKDEIVNKEIEVDFDLNII